MRCPPVPAIAGLLAARNPREPALAGNWGLYELSGIDLCADVLQGVLLSTGKGLLGLS
jgi:hypothetical protein